MTKNPCFQKVDCYINLIASCKVKLEKFGAGGQEHFEKVCGKNLTKVACGRSSKKIYIYFPIKLDFLSLTILTVTLSAICLTLFSVYFYFLKHV